MVSYEYLKFSDNIYLMKLPLEVRVRGRTPKIDETIV